MRALWLGLLPMRSALDNGWWPPTHASPNASNASTSAAALSSNGSSTAVGNPPNPTCWESWGFSRSSGTGLNATCAQASQGHPPTESWFFWGLRRGGGICIFSTPSAGGRIRVNEGWILLLLDICGVWLFGEALPSWPLSPASAPALALLMVLQMRNRLWCCKLCHWSCCKK